MSFLELDANIPEGSQYRSRLEISKRNVTTARAKWAPTERTLCNHQEFGVKTNCVAIKWWSFCHSFEKRFILWFIIWIIIFLKLKRIWWESLTGASRKKRREETKRKEIQVVARRRTMKLNSLTLLQSWTTVIPIPPISAPSATGSVSNFTFSKRRILLNRWWA